MPKKSKAELPIFLCASEARYTLIKKNGRKTNLCEWCLINLLSNANNPSALGKVQRILPGMNLICQTTPHIINNLDNTNEKEQNP